MGNSLMEQRDLLIKEAKGILDTASSAARDLDTSEVKRIDEIASSVKEMNAKVEAHSKAQSLIDSFGVKDTEEFRKKNAFGMTLGEHFKDAVDLSHLKSNMTSQAAVVSAPEYKAATDTHQVPTSPAHLILPDIDRNIVRPFQERLWVSDWLLAGTIASNALIYFVEKITGAVEGDFATVAEEGKIPQLHFGGYDEVTEVLRKVAGLIKVTREMLDDADFVVTEINSRLLRRLAIREEALLLNGDGTGTNPLGLLNRPGLQTMTTTSAALADNLYKAIDQVELVTGFTADAVVINPSDYQKLRLAKDGNGQYIAGGPFQGQYGNGAVLIEPPIWGKTVIKTSAVPAGTILTGASDAATVYRKGGIEVETSFENSDDFEHDRVSIKARERLAMAVRVPAAFVKVTVDDA